MSDTRRALRLVAVDRPRLNLDPALGGEAPTVLRGGLGAGTVQVVFLAIEGLPPEAAVAALSADEYARWKRFTATAPARRFAAGRWLLRAALAAALDCRSEEVRFSYGEHEKPGLASPPAGGLAFNLSHTGDLAVLALVRAGRVGIDIEAMRSLTEVARLARRILTPGELAQFRGLPAESQLASLIAAWTRKEAVLKALGTGISGSPGSVSVSFDPTLEGRDVAAVAAGAVLDRWAVRVLAVPPGYQGALAMEAPGRPVAVWQALPVRPDR